jgi:hypothetical protein
MDGDLLLRWMSETRTGTLSALRTRIAWLAGTADMLASRSDAGLWIRDATAMGLMEADWDADRWKAAPSVITRIPEGDDLALFTGSRPVSVIHTLRNSGVDIVEAPRAENPGRLGRAATLWLRFDDTSQLIEAARDSGCQYVPCAAVQMAAMLAPVGPGPEAAAPAHGNVTLERYHVTSGTWQAFASAATMPASLYQLERQGRKAYLLHRGGRWFRTTYAEGVHLELAAAGVRPMRWRRDAARRETGTLFIDHGAPLPALHLRVAALCTGLPPRVAGKARTLAFDNVPQTVAWQLSSSLGHTLEELENQ